MGLLARLRRRRTPDALAYAPDDPSLVVVVEAFDPARADSAVLAEAAERGVDLRRPLLVRHHLAGLTAEAVAQARALVAPDGYAVVDGGRRPDELAVLVCRTQVLTALSASQERSRMAGLAARLGGDALGWDAMRPATADAASEPSG